MIIQELTKKIDQIEGFYIALSTQKDTLEKEIEVLKQDIEINTKTSAVLKHLLDLMVKNEVTRMASLITYGLKTIFNDQNLTFVPEIKTKSGKVYVEFITLNEDVETDFKSSGGSVSVIESFLLRVLYILKKNFARLIFLDETFAAINDQYIPNTGNFIKELSKKLDMDILLVTQETEYKNYAHQAYKVTKTNNELVMEKIK